MKNRIWIAFKFLVIMTFLTGIVYPYFVMGISQTIFSAKANGSLLMKDGKIIGSKLIGQKFDSSAYFWSRPSATDYNPIPSGASNLGPTSTKLFNLVNERSKSFIAANKLQATTPLPGEMLFASASGLDPHTSPDAVRLQVRRIVRARHFNSRQEQYLNDLITRNTEKRQFGILGEERINIIMLNIDLDTIK